jgi:hypothetical protein
MILFRAKLKVSRAGTVFLRLVLTRTEVSLYLEHVRRLKYNVELLSQVNSASVSGSLHSAGIVTRKTLSDKIGAEATTVKVYLVLIVF